MTVPVGCILGYRNDLKLISDNIMLINDEAFPYNALNQKIIHSKKANQKRFIKHDAPNWRNVSKEFNQNKLEKLKKICTSNDTELIKANKKRQLKTLDLEIKASNSIFGNSFRALKLNDAILYLDWKNNITFETFNKFLDDFYKVHYLLRNELSIEYWNIGYQSLLDNDDIDRILLLEIAYPIVIVRKFNELNLSSFYN